MNIQWAVLWIAGLVITLAACQEQAGTTAKPADVMAITAEIEALESQWSMAAGAKNAAEFASYYADDAAAFFADVPAMHGKAAISAGITAMFDDPNFSLSFEPTRVHVAASGDLACSEGTFAQSFTDPASSGKIEASGNYVTCWRKQGDGAWKAVNDIAVAEKSTPVAAPADEPAAPAVVE